jgi:predicted metal-dependent HD superfamily phosphohydrolase
MKIKRISMTQTIQNSTCASLDETGKDLTKNKPETDNNNELLISAYNSMNRLYETLTRLDCLLQKRTIEQILFPKDKE